ncbi:MAG: hypothetical protein ACXW15_11845, partial [Acidimicrobiia bacterium]
TEDEQERPVRRPEADEMVAELEYKGRNPDRPIHLPSPSYFPIAVGLSLPVVGYGIIYHGEVWGLAMLALGVLATVTSFIGWAQEPADEEPAGEHH